mmetsp:Transcript_49129/g.77674  ORF Transcript_49129/g.77674 Transcript_49129/m.77674 type:complete len:282 (+) Transcript_49129:369-1214(+)
MLSMRGHYIGGCRLRGIRMRHCRWNWKCESATRRSSRNTKKSSMVEWLWRYRLVPSTARRKTSTIRCSDYCRAPEDLEGVPAAEHLAPLGAASAVLRGLRRIRHGIHASHALCLVVGFQRVAESYMEQSRRHCEIFLAAASETRTQSRLPLRTALRSDVFPSTRTTDYVPIAARHFRRRLSSKMVCDFAIRRCTRMSCPWLELVRLFRTQSMIWLCLQMACHVVPSGQRSLRNTWRPQKRGWRNSSCRKIRYRRKLASCRPTWRPEAIKWQSWLQSLVREM